MAHHKRRRPKHQRAGCLHCKPHKDERETAERRTLRTEIPALTAEAREWLLEQEAYAPCSDLPGLRGLWNQHSHARHLAALCGLWHLRGVDVCSPGACPPLAPWLSFRQWGSIPIIFRPTDSRPRISAETLPARSKRPFAESAWRRRCAAQSMRAT